VAVFRTSSVFGIHIALNYINITVFHYRLIETSIFGICY